MEIILIQHKKELSQVIFLKVKILLKCSMIIAIINKIRNEKKTKERENLQMMIDEGRFQVF